MQDVHNRGQVRSKQAHVSDCCSGHAAAVQLSQRPWHDGVEVQQPSLDGLSLNIVIPSCVACGTQAQ